MLVELNPVAAAELPLDALRDHLRLGTGFADDALQDGVLEAALRAALASAEARTGKATLTRDFAWTCARLARSQALPLAPIASVAEVVITDADGRETALTPADLRLVRDAHVPRLCARRAWPAQADGGLARVTFTAGFGDWDAVPAELSQAILRLAAHLYETRGDAEAEAPYTVGALLSRWRAPRLGAAR
ncbi:MAG: head-tail connector protein [Paracoccaceae bacterium]